jgi:FKBP-type peptidyl-prolyl cis-trans isomerase (trigger factor)
MFRPKFNLGEYSGLSVKAEETQPDPESVDKFLEQRRTRASDPNSRRITPCSDGRCGSRRLQRSIYG